MSYVDDGPDIEAQTRALHSPHFMDWPFRDFGAWCLAIFSALCLLGLMQMLACW